MSWDLYLAIATSLKQILGFLAFYVNKAPICSALTRSQQEARARTQMTDIRCVENALRVLRRKRNGSKELLQTDNSYFRVKGAPQTQRVKETLDWFLDYSYFRV